MWRPSLCTDSIFDVIYNNYFTYFSFAQSDGSTEMFYNRGKEGEDEKEDQDENSGFVTNKKPTEMHQIILANLVELPGDFSLMIKEEDEEEDKEKEHDSDGEKSNSGAEDSKPKRQK